MYISADDKKDKNRKIKLLVAKNQKGGININSFIQFNIVFSTVLNLVKACWVILDFSAIEYGSNSLIFCVEVINIKS